MSQITLFDTAPHPRYRKTDPQTSVDAARTVGRGVTSMILRVMHEEPAHAFTADELAARLPLCRMDTLRGAVSRLAHRGVIVPAGTGVSDAGCPMTRYRLS